MELHLSYFIVQYICFNVKNGYKPVLLKHINVLNLKPHFEVESEKKILVLEMNILVQLLCFMCLLLLPKNMFKNNDIDTKLVFCLMGDKWVQPNFKDLITWY